MQRVLLIKQTLESDFDAGSLMLDGPNVKLSDSSEIMSKVPSVEREYFAITYAEDVNETKAYYKFRARKGIHIDGMFYRSEEFPEGIRLHTGLKSGEIEPMLPEERFGPLKKVFEERDNKISWHIVRKRCFLEVELKIDKRTVPFGAAIIPAGGLASLARRLIHVPGLRGNPERSYRAAISDSFYPGSFEKYVASIIHNWKSNRSDRVKFSTLREHLNHLGLASSIDTISINETRLEIRISRHSGCTSSIPDNVNIADVGFGVSQTLPVLVALLAAKRDQVVYIEQPELHLHPRAQYNLASIIASAVADRNVRVVIETHSSILIRGIQILVAKKQLKSEMVSLNWFTQHPETGQTEISEAKLDRFGAFGDWPEDFDDTALTVEQAYLDAVEEAVEDER